MAQEVYYIRDNGDQYCEGPLSEMPPDGIQVPRRPGSDYRWDINTNQWVFNQDIARAEFMGVSDQELKRTDKFFAIDYVISPQDKQIVIDYRNSLRGYMSNPTETLPVCPYEATDDFYYNITP